jgi:hypothetical protein
MRQKKALPVYHDESYGLPHQLTWRSYVIVDEQKFCCEQNFNTKIAAQQDAARVAYKFAYKFYANSSTSSSSPITSNLSITSNPTELKEVYIHKSPEWVVLVDVENLQPIIIHGKPIEYYVFMSEFSSIDPAKYQSMISRVIKVDSSNSDAADHLMSYYTGQLTKTHLAKKYIILSRDKASATLATLLEADGFIVKHFKDVNAFHSFIESL